MANSVVVIIVTASAVSNFKFGFVELNSYKSRPSTDARHAEPIAEECKNLFGNTKEWETSVRKSLDETVQKIKGTLMQI